MQTPRLLRTGDQVGIISTARKISEQEVQPAIDKLEKWGLKVLKGNNLHAEHNQFAGTTTQRVNDLQAMINNPNIRAIFCARGGYGTVQIIDQIDWANFRRVPKWIIGYSDITVLHSHIQKNYSIESIHGTMPINFPANGKDNEALRTLWNALFTGKNQYVFPSHPFNTKGIAQAEIFGGNLSILNSIMGSNSDLNIKNNLLFFEDLDEYLYHIDRMMMNMQRNDKFKFIKGLVIGGMSDMNDNAIPYGQNAEEIIYEMMKQYKFPVSFNFPAGHIADNRAIILGRKSVLEVGENESKFIQY